MHVLESTNKLIQEKAVMLWELGYHLLWSLDAGQTPWAQRQHIDIFELPSGRGQHNVFNLDYVWVTKQPKKLDFPQNASSIRDILKNIIYLLDRNPLPSVTINCSSNYSITSLANNLLDMILTRLPIFREEIHVQCSIKIRICTSFLCPKYEFANKLKTYKESILGWRNNYTGQNKNLLNRTNLSGTKKYIYNIHEEVIQVRSRIFQRTNDKQAREFERHSIEIELLIYLM